MADMRVQVMPWDLGTSLAAAELANDAAAAATSSSGAADTATTAADVATAAADAAASAATEAASDADEAATAALQAAGEADAAATTASDAASDADTAATAANTAAANSSARYIIAAQIDGLVGSSETVLRHVPAEAITMPAGMTLSVGYAGVTVTAQRAWSVRKNGVEFGTITWAIGSNTPTFAAAAEATFNGTTDRLSVVATATADATLADIAITIRGVTAS